VPPDPAAFATRDGTFLSRRAGEFVQTQNPLDVALRGDVWLGIEANGQQAYTRDGRLRMTAEGNLETLNGHAVLDAGGAPIALDPAGGAPQIAADGAIVQNGVQIGALGLFRIPDEARLSRFENAAVVPSLPAEPALDFSTAGVIQGFIERSNVNAVLEMTHLIGVQRSFEALTNAISRTEDTFLEGIRTLGATS
jgi:flagellar basal-body rod protein FlgF